MFRSRRLAFRVVAVWVLLAGGALLFPGIANVVFGLNLTNWGLASEYGGVLLALAALYWLFSSDPERYAPVTGLVALGLLLNAAINAYWWAVGHYSAQSAALNVVLNTGLGVWLWSLRPRTASAHPAQLG